LLACAVALMGTSLPESDYKTPQGFSRWCVGTAGITASIGLNEPLFSELKGLKGKHPGFETATEAQLQKVAREFLQPYIDKKISVQVNGIKYPVKVDRLVRGDNSIYSIWISVNNIKLDRKLNDLKIDYQMLFEEIKNNHLNQAYLYRSDAKGAAAQALFDSVPAEAQYDFTNNGKPWELTVKGGEARDGNYTMMRSGRRQ
jgi:hypothetical protein